MPKCIHHRADIIDDVIIDLHLDLLETNKISLGGIILVGDEELIIMNFIWRQAILTVVEGDNNIIPSTYWIPKLFVKFTLCPSTLKPQTLTNRSPEGRSSWNRQKQHSRPSWSQPSSSYGTRLSGKKNAGSTRPKDWQKNRTVEHLNFVDFQEKGHPGALTTNILTFNKWSN